MLLSLCKMSNQECDVKRRCACVEEKIIRKKVNDDQFSFYLKFSINSVRKR